MRTLQRNKRTISYALYTGVSEITDEDGNYTGEYEVTYATPVTTRMNVSGSRGRAEVEMFGIDNPFTHTVVTDDLTTEFNTDTIWWFGIDPGENGEVPHNFRCTGVSRTINQVVIALAEVDVAFEPAQEPTPTPTPNPDPDEPPEDGVYDGDIG